MKSPQCNAAGDHHAPETSYNSPTDSAKTNVNSQESPNSSSTTISSSSSLAQSEMSTTNSQSSSDSVIRIGHFPHPPQERHSLLESKESEGFLNLFGLFVLMWSLLEMYRNYRTDGFLIDWTMVWHMLTGVEYLMMYWLVIVLFTTMVSLGLEFTMVRWAQKERISNLFDGSLCVVYGVAQLTLFGVMTAIMFKTNELNALFRAFLAGQLIVNSFKMHSYFITNRYFREEIVYGGKYKENDNKPIFNDDYENIRIISGSKWNQFCGLLSEYTTFARIPSLVFEIDFPRTKNISLLYVIREFGGGILIVLCMYLIVQRFVSPQLAHVSNYEEWYDLFLNLALPSLVLWIMLFYSVFHSFLNGTAELARYADREFYLAWWNATTVAQYWRMWNRPVFKFMSRHVYVESMRRVKGYNRVLAALSTFFFTAVMHEYVMICTFRIVRYYYFVMIIGQIPLFYITEMLSGTRLGNVLLWFGFMLSFPALQLLYFRSYLLENGNFLAS